MASSRSSPPFCSGTRHASRAHPRVRSASHGTDLARAAADGRDQRRTVHRTNVGGRDLFDEHRALADAGVESREATRLQPLVLSVGREGGLYLNIGGNPQTALDEDTAAARATAAL